MNSKFSLIKSVALAAALRQVSRPRYGVDSSNGSIRIVDCVSRPSS